MPDQALGRTVPQPIPCECRCTATCGGDCSRGGTRPPARRAAGVRPTRQPTPSCPRHRRPETACEIVTCSRGTRGRKGNEGESSAGLHGGLNGADSWLLPPGRRLGVRQRAPGRGIVTRAETPPVVTPEASSPELGPRPCGWKGRLRGQCLSTSAISCRGVSCGPCALGPEKGQRCTSPTSARSARLHQRYASPPPPPHTHQSPPMLLWWWRGETCIWAVARGTMSLNPQFCILKKRKIKIWLGAQNATFG